MNGFDVSETMRAARYLWRKYAHDLMKETALPLGNEREIRPQADEAEMRQMAAEWDAGAPTINTIQRKYGRATSTIKRAIQRYGRRPLERPKTKRESAMLAVAARRAKAAAV